MTVAWVSSRRGLRRRGRRFGMGDMETCAAQGGVAAGVGDGRADRREHRAARGGAIVYANKIPWFGYTVMGHRMPAFILVGAMPYVAIGGYLAYRYLLNGRSLRDILLLSAVYVGIPEIIIEAVWHHYGIIAYYGDNPARVFGIPLYSIVQNTTLLPVYGVIIYFAARYLARILWLVLFIPATTIGYIVGVSWPAYQAVQSSAPAPVVWLAAAIVMVPALAGTYLALQIPELRQLQNIDP